MAHDDEKVFNEQPDESRHPENEAPPQPVDNKSNSPAPSESDDEKKEKAPTHTTNADDKKGKLPFSIGVLIFTILVCIAFVFCLAGMSIGMMDHRDNSSCISIWGYKPECLKTWFRHFDWDTFGPNGTKCNKGDSLMQGAQAFSVMSMIGGFLSACAAILEVIRYAEFAVVACIISCINTVATLVVWSTMLAMYWANLCGVGVFADTYRIGNGLILFITAWCLQMTANITLMIDVYLGNSR